MASATPNALDLVKGIDQQSASHLLKPGKWLNSLNMRFRRGEITQVERKVPYGRPDYAFRWPVTAIAALPTGTRDRTYLLAFAGSRVFRIFPGPVFEQLGGDNQLVGADADVRWATAVHGDRVYFSNKLNKIAWTSGTNVKKLVGKFVPKAQYLEIFYDHIVAGNIIQAGGENPYRFCWSDLYNISTWEPKRSNEADYYDCLERLKKVEDVPGITGIARMGKMLNVYTSSMIFAATYVGLPRIMNTEPVVPGVGCDFYYGLASLENVQFFPNQRYKTFFHFSPAGLKDIGAEVSKFFYADLHPGYEERQRLWCFVSEPENEIWWVYISKNSSIAQGYDKAVVYNFQENHWFPASVENISAFGESTRIASKVDGLTGTIDGLSGRINNLGTEETTGRLWGGQNGRLLRDAILADPAANLVQTSVPFLETGDKSYEDLGTVKELSSVVIDANATELELDIVKRNLHSDSVVYNLQEQTWVPTLVEKRLSFPRAAANVFRLRFRPKAPNSTPLLTGGTLAAEIATKEVTVQGGLQFVEEILTGFGEWFPPYVGNYTITLIGGGGGGSAIPLLVPTQPLPPPNIGVGYVFDNTTAPVPLVTNVPSRSTTIDYRLAIGLTDYLVALLDPTFQLNPNLTPRYTLEPMAPGELSTVLTTQFRDLWYTSAIAYAKRAVESSGRVYLGVIDIRFRSISPVGGSSHTVLSWPMMSQVAAVNSLITTQTSYWYVSVTVLYNESSERPWRRGGGGSGGYTKIVYPVANKITDAFRYSVGFNHLEPFYDYRAAINRADGVIFGSHGAGSQIWQGTFPILNFIVSSAGGTGGEVSAGTDIIDGGAGGSSIADDGSPPAWNILDQVDGDFPVAEAPLSGAPVTTAPLGGRGFNVDKTRGPWNTQDHDVTGYGAGAAGIVTDVSGVSRAAEGGPPLLRIAYYVDLATQTAIAETAAPNGLPPSPIEGLASGESRDSIFVLPGASNVGYAVRFKVSGVVQANLSAGGVPLDTHLIRNATPSAGEPYFILRTGNASYLLNHGTTPISESCFRIDYEFEAVVFGQTPITLEVISPVGVQLPPHDSAGEVIDSANEGSNFPRSQWVVVEAEILDQVSHSVRGFTFKGFSEKVIGLRAEK